MIAHFVLCFSWADTYGLVAHTYTEFSYRKPPEPRPWCQFLVDHIDAPSWFRNFQDGDASWVGSRWHLLPMGLVECIERFSFYNYCHWLALLPLAQMHPTKSPSIYNKTRTANYPNLYLTAARRTLSLSEAQPIVTHGSRTSEAAEITDYRWGKQNAWPS